MCDATTGEPLAEVILEPATGEITTRARSGHDDAAAAAAESVRRFAAETGVPFGDYRNRIEGTTGRE